MINPEKSTTALLAASAALATCLGVTLAAPAHAKKPGSNSDTGTGSVFQVNPVQSTGDQTLIDRKDSAGAVPASAYASVELRNLDGSGKLVGTWVNVRSATGPEAYSATNTFNYTRDDDRFEQVMAYFWVNQAQEYLRSLGFGTTLRPVNAGVAGPPDQPVRHRQLLLAGTSTTTSGSARAGSMTPRTAR